MDQIKYLVVGSAALNYIEPYRQASDIDIIASYDDIQRLLRFFNVKQNYPIAGGKKIFAVVENGHQFEWCSGMPEEFIIEAEIAWDNGSSADMILNSSDSAYVLFPAIANINTLYWMKMSHRYLKNSPFFKKTMGDIRYMRKQNPLIIFSNPPEWFAKREEETYSYKHPNLNVKKNEFFDNSTDLYVYDHDSIHEAVKINYKPAYQYYKPNENEVYTCKEMFFNQSESIRLAGVYEEAAVLALERCLIPFDFKVDPKKAFRMALEKVCTSITSGWFREYAWENYDKVIELSEEKDFVKDFDDGLWLGIVKPFSS